MEGEREAVEAPPPGYDQAVANDLKANVLARGFIEVEKRATQWLAMYAVVTRDGEVTIYNGRGPSDGIYLACGETLAIRSKCFASCC